MGDGGRYCSMITIGSMYIEMWQTFRCSSCSSTGYPILLLFEINIKGEFGLVIFNVIWVC